MTTQEDFFNLALAQVIENRNDGWITDGQNVIVEERKVIEDNPKLKPDIIITGAGKPPVNIECEYSNQPEGDTSKYLGRKVARSRGGGVIEHAVAVRIPGKYRRMSQAKARKKLEGGSRIDYAIVEATEGVERRFPREGFLRGTVTDMVRLAGAMAPGTRKVQEVANDAKALIEDNIRTMDERLDEETQEAIMGRLMQWTHLSGLSAANVLWLDALLTQQELARHGARDLEGKRIPGMPSRTGAGLVRETVRVWKRIRDKNWKAIFVPAIEALERSENADWESTHLVMANLVDAVKEIATKRISRELSIGGELFPKVTEGRKHTAAFYTRPPMADLIATLTIRQGDVDWKDARVLAEHQIQDLACGTGTLLRAGYRRGEALHRQAGGSIGSTRIFHKTAMEEGIYGCDINAIARHMTSSTLAATGAGWDYGDTQIAWLPVGGSKGQVELGGLGFLRGGKRPGQLELMGGTVGGDTKQSSGKTAEGETNAPFMLPERGARWTLMNPPYSRTHGGRGTKKKREKIAQQGVPDEDDGTGQGAFEIPGLSEEERRLCQEEWGRRLQRGRYAANKKAGMAASFACIAVETTRPGGRIGLILPTSAAAEPSWEQTRAMLEEHLDDMLVVATRAHKRLKGDQQSVSADTGMEEMMLVGTVRAVARGKGESGKLMAVTLEEAPQEAGEGPEVGKAILEAAGGKGPSRPVRLGETDIGILMEYETEGGAPWSAVAAEDPALVHSIHRLKKKGELVCLYTGYKGQVPVPMTRITQAVEVGPTHDKIGHPAGGDGRGEYRMTPYTGKRTSEQALWGADSKKQTTMLVGPSHNATLVGSETEAEKLERRKGRLFYARGMRWTSQKILAAVTQQRLHGGRAWTALQAKNRKAEKCYALWLNSTLGMAIHWSRAGRQQAGRGPTQVQAIQAMQVPELGRLPEQTLNLGAKLFDKLARKELLPGRAAAIDETRAEIDDAISEMLGWGDDEKEAIRSIRERWCQEASVQGGREQEDPPARYESAPEEVQRTRGQRRLWLVRKVA